VKPAPAPTPPPTTTYKPHEQRDNMIDKFSSLWPQLSEDTLLTVEEGTNKLRVIDTSSVQEDNVDQGTFTFRRGRCAKFPRAVSIEAKLQAGKFWRHQEGKIHLQGGEDTEDICFNVVKAGCEDGGFALQAANNPGKFVKKCGDKIELRTRADNCGDENNMCWANPVSEQASLAFCESSVTTEDDVYKYPQCCSHEGTLEKFGACCRENITTCKNPVHSLSYCTKYIQFALHSPTILWKYPQCCLHPHFRSLYHIRPSIGETCRKMNMMRGKRAQAACNMPCRSLWYCPSKMTQDSGWEGKKPNCCCHPYRISMKKKNLNYLGTCAGLG